MYPESLKNLIESFKLLPGVGEKTAERMAFFLINEDEEKTTFFSDSIKNAKKNIRKCSVCNGITDKEICDICSNNLRNKKVICVVEDPKSIFLFEKIGTYNGDYHVLNGLISPLDGIDPDDIGIEKISLEDPFGIYKVILDVPYKFRAVVSPQITDMASKAIEIENIFNNRGLSSDNLVQEIPGSDIRPYVAGDSLHSINWKVSAKIGDIMVRVPDNMERQTVTMLLLADEKEEDKYTITALKRRDYFLEFIVSAAWYFASEDMPVKFIYPAGRISQFTVDSKRSFSEFYSIVADGIFYNSPGVYKDLKDTLQNQGKGVYGEDTWIVVTENPKENEEFCRIY